VACKFTADTATILDTINLIQWGLETDTTTVAFTPYVRSGYTTDDFINNYNTTTSNITAVKDATNKLVLTAPSVEDYTTDKFISLYNSANSNIVAEKDELGNLKLNAPTSQVVTTGKGVEVDADGKVNLLVDTNTFSISNDDNTLQFNGNIPHGFQDNVNDQEQVTG
jgi:hypothetical protein